MKRSRLELRLSPYYPRQDGNQPSQIISRNSKREQRLSSRWRDEREQAEHGGEEDATPDSAERDVAEFLGDGAEEAGEGEGAVAREGPGLAGGGYEDGEAHEELDDH